MESVDRQLARRIREHEAVPCPHCGVEALWAGAPEYSEHVELCKQLTLGQLKDAVNEVVPTVEKKPQGWRWQG